MGENDHFLAIFIDMCKVVVTIFDRFLRLHELTDVYRASICELLQVIGEILQVIAEILCISNLLNEARLDLINFSFFRFTLSIFSLLLSALLSKRCDVLLHSNKLLNTV